MIGIIIVIFIFIVIGMVVVGVIIGNIRIVIDLIIKFFKSNCLRKENNDKNN